MKMMIMRQNNLSAAAILSFSALFVSFAVGFIPPHSIPSPPAVVVNKKYSTKLPFLAPGGVGVSGDHRTWSRIASSSDENSNNGETKDIQTAESAVSSAPVLNGKRVLPFKVLTGGLKGHKVAAVYAVMNSNYKRGYAGWDYCEFVGTTMDLDSTLQDHLDVHGSDRVAHIRALSFLIPSQSAMDDVAEEWCNEMKAAGGKVLSSFDKDAIINQAIEDAIPYDDDDDDEDEDDEDFMAMRAEALAMARGAQSGEGTPTSSEQQTVVSPFDDSSSNQQPATSTMDGGGDETPLEFNKANVDTVLDEIRPYLISDGGNVSVDRVDEETKNVYLKLEGACGSCPSSTVTMQMGIERVLKEKFEGLGEVLQVQEEDGDGGGKPIELTYQAIEAEVNRIRPAIIAMGGSVDIVSVDPVGVVELKYQGAKKIRQGVELAILDVEFVRHVIFVDDD